MATGTASASPLLSKNSTVATGFSGVIDKLVICRLALASYNQCPSTVHFVINPDIILVANGTINASNAITLGGVVSGSGFGFTKLGSGVLNLSTTAPNTYTGATTLGTAGSATSVGTLTLSGLQTLAGSDRLCKRRDLCWCAPSCRPGG